jgi:hypothetical protein
MSLVPTPSPGSKPGGFSRILERKAGYRLIEWPFHIHRGPPADLRGVGRWFNLGDLHEISAKSASQHVDVPRGTVLISTAPHLRFVPAAYCGPNRISL